MRVYYAIGLITSTLVCAFFVLGLDIITELTPRVAATEVYMPNLITYQLTYVWKKKIKTGNVIEQEAGPQTFLDTPYHYRIEGIHSRKPVLKKFIGNDLVEEKELTILNITDQANIYLAERHSSWQCLSHIYLPKAKNSGCVDAVLVES